MNYDCEVNEVNIIKTANKVKYINAKLKNLIFKIF